MTKVIGVKVNDDFYNKIKDEYDNISQYLKKCIDYYEKSKVDVVNSNVNHIKKDSEYNLLCKALDSLPVRYNRFFSKTDKKGGLD